MIKNNQTLPLSVVIPVYNEQQTIKTVIHTVSNSKIVNEIVIVDEGEICHNILLLSQNEKIIAEPAGAMSIAALRKYKNKIKNKNIMCLICGGNNDPKRLPEIEKRSEEWLDKVKNETN